jgi:hypothetical protein
MISPIVSCRRARLKRRTQWRQDEADGLPRTSRLLQVMIDRFNRLALLRACRRTVAPGCRRCNSPFPADDATRHPDIWSSIPASRIGILPCVRIQRTSPAPLCNMHRLWQQGNKERPQCAKLWCARFAPSFLTPLAAVPALVSISEPGMDDVPEIPWMTDTLPAGRAEPDRDRRLALDIVIHQIGRPRSAFCCCTYRTVLREHCSAAAPGGRRACRDSLEEDMPQFDCMNRSGRHT